MENFLVEKNDNGTITVSTIFSGEYYKMIFLQGDYKKKEMEKMLMDSIKS